MLALLPFGGAWAADDCPAAVHEQSRPAAPCIDRSADRIWTPRLVWPEAVERMPPENGPITAGLAALLAAEPAIARVRIEGHLMPDARRQAFGRCISCKRADGLRDALIALGVHPARLVSKGYDSDRPMVDPRDPAQAPLNQRFEVHIEQWAPQPDPICPEGVDERHRPAAACVSPDGARIWLPPVPRKPKYTVFPPVAWPIGDELVRLLRASPRIARIRIEMHDYRDPNAANWGKCRPCARAEAMAQYLIDHGVDADRVTAAGHHQDRLASRHTLAQAKADGMARYEVHIERWGPPVAATQGPPDEPPGE